MKFHICGTFRRSNLMLIVLVLVVVLVLGNQNFIEDEDEYDDESRTL